MTTRYTVAYTLPVRWITVPDITAAVCAYSTTYLTRCSQVTGSWVHGTSCSDSPRFQLYLVLYASMLVGLVEHLFETHIIV